MDVVTMLQQDPEPLPAWLRQPSPGFDRKSFFGSRTVFYPGSGIDGHPVSVCARAHAAHAFVYVDYGVSKQAIRDRIHNIRGPGFRGYPVEHEEEVEEAVLRPGGWTQHVDQERLSTARFASVEPFGLYVVLRRDEDHDDSHGPERLALLFVGGDGHAAYDALYCQADGTPPPFLVVVEDYGFGGNYSSFGTRGLLERIACRCDVLPRWLLVGPRGRGGSYRPWSGYRDTGATPEHGGMQGRPRRLFRREEPGAAPEA